MPSRVTRVLKKIPIIGSIIRARQLNSLTTREKFQHSERHPREIVLKPVGGDLKDWSRYGKNVRAERIKRDARIKTAVKNRAKRIGKAARK